jgi:5'-phosphate synthase pdxT subunit
MILLADRVDDSGSGGPGVPETLGGIDMTVRRNAFGRQVDSFEQNVAVDSVGDVRAVFIRAPWVSSVGPAATALGRISGGTAAGRIVVVRQQQLLATSFHPELTGDGRMHAYFCRMVQDARTDGEGGAGTRSLA